MSIDLFKFNQVNEKYQLCKKTKIDVQKLQFENVSSYARILNAGRLSAEIKSVTQREHSSFSCFYIFRYIFFQFHAFFFSINYEMQLYRAPFFSFREKSISTVNNEFLSSRSKNILL